MLCAYIITDNQVLFSFWHAENFYLLCRINTRHTKRNSMRIVVAIQGNDIYSALFQFCLSQTIHELSNYMGYLSCVRSLLRISMKPSEFVELDVMIILLSCVFSFEHGFIKTLTHCRTVLKIVSKID